MVAKRPLMCLKECLRQTAHARKIRLTDLSLMGNEEVLTYKDIVLRRTDLDILEGPCYLNDQTIGFYFTYLSSLFTSQDVLLSPPSVSFWLANYQDVESAKDFVKPLKLSGKELEVFTVTIMMILVDTNTFAHHDSMEGVNNFHAMKLYEAVKGFMGSDAEASSLTSSSSMNLSKKCHTLQQMNGYDCGLYISITFASKYKGKDDNWFSAVEEHVDASLEMKMRNEVISLIEDLRVES
ncbi:hypothetical protein HYC85_013280 [Camellia sinensis]|uniref:Ubiquitin-like protease family profile domain-containing protein n=1 Tax=Camellia sinensis TaxID=4442 RepID=A0A7J7H2X7_CAMSI|nr:hypothetical protein HYC85_013280 [Camellia sinensis]